MSVDGLQEGWEVCLVYFVDGTQVTPFQLLVLDNVVPDVRKGSAGAKHIYPVLGGVYSESSVTATGDVAGLTPSIGGRAVGCADETQGGFGNPLFADRYWQLSVKLGRGCWFSSVLDFGWLGF